ncbi:MAG: thermonuclease family protein [Allosphingosinicella sp.]
MGELIPFGRRRRRSALPAQWTRHVRPPAFSAGQIRLAIWSGLLLGLLLFQATRYWPEPVEADEPPIVALKDPWAESRRSRKILEPQEKAPPPFAPARGSRPVRGDRSVRVIDGDTFVHAGTRIRIADIDTPEVQGRCPAESALAARATRRLDGLLAEGAFELHSLPGGRDRDRYGRRLRIVTQGGRSIGDVLVEEGLARTWTGRREHWCA